MVLWLVCDYLNLYHWRIVWARFLYGMRVTDGVVDWLGLNVITGYYQHYELEMIDFEWKFGFRYKKHGLVLICVYSIRKLSFLLAKSVA